jgi:ATP phosphoribosyltransferase
VIAKPTDVPVYVAYGAADCGVGGKDVLLEADLELVELVDLGFGGCRFVVAAPEDAADLDDRYGHLGVLRVATKYPRIAEQHFATSGIQVEIVKLNGNIELAPLIGIADVIVDITATGTTLRQNRLRIVEDVLPSTARFIANPAALRTDERVVQLAETLAALVSAKGIESEARPGSPAPHGRDL